MYVMLQLVADVTAVKLIKFDRWAIPGGTLIFAVTFTWRDVLHKRLGKEWARAAIVTAALANLIMALYFQLAINMTPVVFWGGQAAFEATLGIVWRIVLASIIAEFISEMVDTEVYGFLAPRFPGRTQFLRVVGSNAVSLPLDSIIFASLAFGGDMPFADLTDLIWGQIVFKALITLVSLPLIYTVPERPLTTLPLPAPGD